MSEATAAPASPWRPFATATYFLAVLIVLAPAIGFGSAIWPLHPSRLPWRHIGSGMLITSAPMIAAAAVGSLLAAKLRGDLRVLRLLRLGGLIALILGIPTAFLYIVDSVRIHHDLPAGRASSFVGIETRMIGMMAVMLVLLWMLCRAARDEARSTTPAAPPEGLPGPGPTGGVNIAPIVS